MTIPERLRTAATAERLSDWVRYGNSGNFETAGETAERNDP